MLHWHFTGYGITDTVQSGDRPPPHHTSGNRAQGIDGIRVLFAGAAPRYVANAN
jgi:hypothetical protein